ncbi:type 1 glutamine amidotransferase [Vibrio panuliri]|uniref:type 1 glutamine amidotransferase n=1 Tax=Vibrio panuliri TaxID=1381081 RepID=UPI0009F969BD|nr:type 1 glutamine amidotransferase [Vibrio panuliri]KAB1457252.1 type 1 glutamine amidotransferase [Vibrio panuliri]
MNIKIGILQCDDVSEGLKLEHGNYPVMFSKLFDEGGGGVDLVFFRAMDGELPQDVNECDVYMTTGSRHSVNDDLPWIPPLLNFIKLLDISKKKLVGICFGHQLIAKSLGGYVTKASQGWGVGVMTHWLFELPSGVNVEIKSPMSISLVVSHEDQVVSLPPQAKVLAGSNFCPFYMIQFGEHFFGYSRTSRV